MPKEQFDPTGYYLIIFMMFIFGSASIIRIRRGIKFLRSGEGQAFPLKKYAHIGEIFVGCVLIFGILIVMTKIL
ncbi:MAG: hypothetical protein GY797_11240 [Deltaproteobacteria bacterium]|nr:hypothetical protein [Deltaproteobacteria bacterium]